jgi:hypothetical protein
MDYDKLADASGMTDSWIGWRNMARRLENFTLVGWPDVFVMVKKTSSVSSGRL